MNDLIRKRDIDYISAPIAPVLKGENVHYEYVAFRKQIEDISPVPAIPITENATNGDMIRALFSNVKWWINEDNEVFTDHKTINSNRVAINADWWNAPYKAESEEK